MDTNAKALELLRQIAADTRATREAVERMEARRAEPNGATAENIKHALVEIAKVQAEMARGDFLSMFAAPAERFERNHTEAQARIERGARQTNGRAQGSPLSN